VSLVYNAEDIATDPQYRARDMIVEVEDPLFGTTLQPAPVPKLSRTPGRVYSPAPTIGGNNREIFFGLLNLTENNTESCQTEHIGYAISGGLVVTYSDGTETKIAAGSVYHIPPGHDAVNSGSEPAVFVEFQGARSRDRRQARGGVGWSRG